jgi:cytoskeletal protein CcmA (bactofilin family)
MFRELLGDSKKKKVDAPAQPKAAPPTPAIDTVLGTGSHLKGTLKTDGNVRVHGTFEGDITAHGKIAVGEQGKVEGDLVGEGVDVAGQVRGNILARKIAVMRSGRVWGDLRLEKLVTEEGAFIQGVVTMEEKVALPHKPEPPKVPEKVETAPAKDEAAPQAETVEKPTPKPQVKPVPKPGAEKVAAVAPKKPAD